MQRNQIVVVQIPGMNLCMPVTALEEALELGREFEQLNEGHRMYEVSVNADGFLRFTLVAPDPSRLLDRKFTAAEALERLRQLSQR